MPIMISNNWLLSYATIAGINTILEQMSRRVKHTNNMDIACVDLEKYYKEFEQDFTLFFEELRAFSKHKINIVYDEKNTRASLFMYTAFIFGNAIAQRKKFHHIHHTSNGTNLSKSDGGICQRRSLTNWE